MQTATETLPQSRKSVEAELLDEMARYSDDPLGFVLFSFPWGKGELEGFDGPDDWQRELLTKVREKLLTVKEAIQIAVASGHGIGKSALIAWLILWAMGTMEDTRCVVTANTEAQLRTKTWPELAKWHRLFIAKHWFTLTATALFSVDPEHEKSWRADCIPWSEHNTEAFAGLHNKGKRIAVFKDEASAISDKIFEVSEGALTDANTQILWFAFGNPTRNTGRFYECWHKFKHRWLTFKVDSRKSKLTNKATLQKMVDDWGEDSDVVRVRIRGEFPKTGDRQMIPTYLVEGARGKSLHPSQYNFAPKVITLDNAWTGGDEVVIGCRQGLAFRILATYPKNDDDIFMARELARFEDQEKADAVFIDFGYGTGVYSAGKNLNRVWTLINSASESSKPEYLNKRAEMWGDTVEWLREGGAIPPDDLLCSELTGPEKERTPKGKIKLESKEDMKARQLPSPNRADALVMSFAFPVEKKVQDYRDEPFSRDAPPAPYDPFARL